MQIDKYRPWGLSSFHDEVSRLFHDFIRPERGPRPLRGEWAPPVDIAETENEIVVKAEVPGMSAEDLNVTIQGDLLTIQGEKKSETEEKGRNYHRVERTFGTFTRTITLPTEVEGDKVEATYENGVIELHLPKKEEARRKEIQIKVK
jgi:HSP20 family protein